MNVDASVVVSGPVLPGQYWSSVGDAAVDTARPLTSKQQHELVAKMLQLLASKRDRPWHRLMLRRVWQGLLDRRLKPEDGEDAFPTFRSEALLAPAQVHADDILVGRPL